jgi:hypothetical protein
MAPKSKSTTGKKRAARSKPVAKADGEKRKAAPQAAGRHVRRKVEKLVAEELKPVRHASHGTVSSWSTDRM